MLGVDLRRQQIVAQLVRKSPPHGSRAQNLTLFQRHLTAEPDDLPRDGHQPVHVGVGEIDLLPRRRIIEPDPAERQSAVTHRSRLVPDDDPEGGRRVGTRLVAAGVRVDLARRAPPHESEPAAAPHGIGLREHARHQRRRYVRRRHDVDDHRRHRCERGNSRSCPASGEGVRCVQSSGEARGDQHLASYRRMRSSEV